MMSYADALLKPKDGAVGIYYEWTSNAQKKDDGYYFWSQTFFAEPLDNTKWRILLHFSGEYAPKSGYLYRSADDGGPESIYVSLLLYVTHNEVDSIITFSILNRVFTKGQDIRLKLEDNRIVSGVPSSSVRFSCELWKSGSVVTSATKDNILSLTNAISRMWNPAPKNAGTTSKSHQHSATEPTLEVEEFWSAKMEPVRNTGTECKVLMYAGVTVFDADVSSVIGMEEKYFTFRHETVGEKDIICSVINSELFKKHSASHEQGHSYDSVNAIEQLIAYLKQTNFHTAVHQNRTQGVHASSQTSEDAVIETDLDASSQTCEDDNDSAIETESSPVSTKIDGSEDLQQTQTVQIPCENSQRSSSPSEKEDNEFSLERELFRAYRNGLLSDVTVCSGDRKWPAHRVILSTRSPVLCEMLKDCSEAGMLLELPDVEPRVMDAVLTFCYTDVLSEDLLLEDFAGLYSAARRFQISQLIELSSSILEYSLSVLNACETCVLADACRDSRLKASAMDFICTHASEVFESEAWLTFMQENVEIAAEVMHYVILQKIMK